MSEAKYEWEPPARNLSRFIPPSVVEACANFGNEDDANARPSVTFHLDGLVTLRIDTDNSCWSTTISLCALEKKVDAFWVDGIRWLGLQ